MSSVVLTTIVLISIYLQCTFCEPIFFEVWCCILYRMIMISLKNQFVMFKIFGFRSECVFDFFDEKEVMQFFYEIRADQRDDRRRTEVEIKIMNENGELLSSRRGYQERVNYEITTGGVYQICFEMVGSTRYERTVVGIEMLGLKSETHYHQKELVKEEHINPMYAKLIDIGGTLDELESLQSASKNWAINYWDQLLFAEENLAFYSWIQGWLLLIVSICQIRMIRQWFAKVGTRLSTKRGGINYRV